MRTTNLALSSVKRDHGQRDRISLRVDWLVSDLLNIRDWREDDSSSGTPPTKSSDKCIDHRVQNLLAMQRGGNHPSVSLLAYPSRSLCGAPARQVSFCVHILASVTLWPVLRVRSSAAFAAVAFRVLTAWHFNDSKLSISAHNGVAFDSFFFLKKMLNSWTALACMGVLWLFVTVVGGELEPSCSHLIIVHQILIIILSNFQRTFSGFRRPRHVFSIIRLIQVLAKAFAAHSFASITKCQQGERQTGVACRIGCMLTATDSMSMLKQNHDSCMLQTVRLKQQKSGASLGENSRRKMMSTSSIRAGS